MAAPDGELDLGLRRFVLPLVFVLGLFVALWLRQPEPPHAPPAAPPVEDSLSLSGPIFGTTWAVRLVPGDQPASDLQPVIEATLQAVDAQMSTYRPDSELSRFNGAGLEPFPASPGLLAVVREAQGVHSLSGGAFDVTVGPLVNAWGFGPDPVVQAPAPEVLAAARAQVDAAALHVEERSLRKDRADLYVDLSAIAKGYAVDAVVEALGQAGHSRFLVEIGGEVRARGRNDRGVPWTVGIETPDGGAQDVHEVVPLDGSAMATSGNYRQLSLVDGRSITHIVDPRSGEPVSHGLGSVSVIAATCAEADALATALYVLGPEDGLALAERRGIAALFLSMEGGSVRRAATQSWPVAP